MNMNNLKKFLDFEKNNKLFELQYRKVNFWHLIRFSLYYKIFFPNRVAHPDFETNSSLQKLRFLPYIFGQLNHCFSSKHFEIFISSPEIKRIVNGIRTNIYINFIYDCYHYSSKRFVFYPGKWDHTAEKNVNTSLIDFIYMIIRIFQKSFTLFLRRDNMEIMKLHSLLTKEFGIKLDYNELYNSIISSVTTYKISKGFFKIILKNKFKMVFISEHYNIYNFALIAACRENEITSIEHQHGVIGKYHPAYNFNDITTSGKYLPDILLTYGTYWSDTCRLPKTTKIIAVGNPLMDYSKNKYKDQIQDKFLIVFYSSGSSQREMSNLALLFSEIACPLGYKLIYKLHPSERLSWKNKLPELIYNKNIFVEDREVNVYELLATAKHHISIDSTVLFEAIAFNANAYVYDILSSYYMDDMINRKYARPFKTQYELLDYITSDTMIVKSNSNFLYKSDSIKNFQSVFDSVIR